MNKKDCITKFEIENGVFFPESYKEILNQFDIFRVYEYQEKDLDIWSISYIFKDIDNEYKCWELLKRNLSTQLIDTNKTFVFGSLGDGIRLFFNLMDMSIWMYYLDDDSIEQLELTFEELLNKSILIASE